MVEVTLIALAVLAFSLAIAYVFIKRSRSILGILLGVAPFALMEIAFNWSLNSNIRQCLDFACADAGLPPGCEINHLGCTEWSGLTLLFYIAVGVLSLGLYVIGVGTIAILHSRGKRNQLPDSPPGGSITAA